MCIYLTIIAIIKAMRDDASLIAEEQYQALDASLRTARGIKKLYQTIVDTPFNDRLLSTSIDLGIIVLLLTNKKNHTVDRVALSDTELAKGAVSVSAKPFHEIRIPLRAKDNCIAQAVKTMKYQLVDDWQYLFTPILTPEQARRNQAGASVECSLIWPLKSGDGGALIFSFYQPIAYVSSDHLAFAERYAALVDKHLTRIGAK